MINKLKNLRPTKSIRSWGGVRQIEIYYSYTTFDGFITGSMWDKLPIPKNKYVINVSKEYATYGNYNEILSDNKEEIDKYTKILQDNLVDNILQNESKIIKILEIRQKQIDKQKQKTLENQTKKKEQLNNISDKIMSNEFQCSKVYNSNHHGTTVKNRTKADKFHKYVEKDTKNIRFATVEVKVNKDDIKIGVKIETRGEIGCSFEEFESLYLKIKNEVEKLQIK